MSTAPFSLLPNIKGESVLTLHEGGCDDDYINAINNYPFDRVFLKMETRLDWLNRIDKRKITKLDIGYAIDLHPISFLSELTDLVVSMHINTSLSFSRLKRLKYFYSVSHGRINTDFYSLESLEELFFTGWKEKDLHCLSHNKNLKNLTLVDSFKLENLNGIESLVGLERLSLVSPRKLSNCENVTNAPSLKYLEMEGCKKVNYGFLENTTKLTSITLRSCSIPSLKLLENNSNLNYLIAGNSNIVDGDLRALLKFKALQLCLFRDKRHYNIKHEELLRIHPGLKLQQSGKTERGCP